jgi:hypothetical protein
MNVLIEEVADRLSLRALVDRYAVAVDARDGDAFPALFLADGILAVHEPGVPDPVAVFTGPDELRRVMGLLRDFGATFHLMANHLCQVGGDVATGEVYCLAHHLVEGAAGTTDLCMVIRYRDSYARTPDGWRFRRRDVMRQWNEERPADRRALDLSGSDA